nr:7963_t:CDS:2 [Entrophospora candida]
MCGNALFTGRFRTFSIDKTENINILRWKMVDRMEGKVSKGFAEGTLSLEYIPLKPTSNSNPGQMIVWRN